MVCVFHSAVELDSYGLYLSCPIHSSCWTRGMSRSSPTSRTVCRTVR
uniref:Uncharacterized protein n=1 Tax=Anguilla anguilla TaxID=7936 RepID=A0A0E9R362_ANGAN